MRTTRKVGRAAITAAEQTLSYQTLKNGDKKFGQKSKPPKATTFLKSRHFDEALLHASGRFLGGRKTHERRCHWNERCLSHPIAHPEDVHDLELQLVARPVALVVRFGPEKLRQVRHATHTGRHRASRNVAASQGAGPVSSGGMWVVSETCVCDTCRNVVRCLDDAFKHCWHPN